MLSLIGQSGEEATAALRGIKEQYEDHKRELQDRIVKLEREVNTARELNGVALTSANEYQEKLKIVEAERDQLVQQHRDKVKALEADKTFMQSQVREAQRVADDWRLDVAEKKESLARGRARVKEAVDGETRAHAELEKVTEAQKEATRARQEVTRQLKESQRRLQETQELLHSTQEEAAAQRDMAASLTTQLEESRQADQRREEVVESLRERLNAANQPGPNLHLHRLKLPEIREEVTKSENSAVVLKRWRAWAGTLRVIEQEEWRSLNQIEEEETRETRATQLGKELDEIWDLVGRQVARCYASTVKDPPTQAWGGPPPQWGATPVNELPGVRTLAEVEGRASS